jgi:hypothetical protein
VNSLIRVSFDMAGAKGKSGPVGNLNAAKYPWRSFWRRRALKPQDKWVLGVLESYAAELIADKGGADSITAGERRMTEIAQTARGASMLILAEAARSGFIVTTKNGQDLSPAAKELPKFLNVERQALQTIGMGRRVKQVTLQDILDAEPDDEEPNETAQNSAPVAQGGTQDGGND